MSVKEFNLAISRFVDDEIPERVALLQRALTLRVLTGVVRRTPVDTGRARSNWSVSNGEKDLSKRAPFTAGAALGLGETENASAAITAGEAVISKIKPFTITYVQNNLPYIEVLESGDGSKQAPQGMLGVTMAEIEASL